jgi:parallel beta-helix repeat protein
MPPVLALPALLLAALIGPAATRADTGASLYVDQHNLNCSNGGAGTVAQPFCTISAAAAKTVPGTTVLISSGTYAETVKPPVSGAPGTPITYTAAPGASVTVTGSSSSSYTFEVAGQSYITLKGLTLSHASGGLAAVEVTNNLSSNIAIVDNKVTRGISVDGGSQVSVTGNQVDKIHLGATGLDVEDNTVDGIALNNAGHSRVAGNSIGAAGIYLYGSNNNTLAANVIQTPGKAIDDEYSNNVTMVNNTIVVYPSPNTTNAYGINVLSGTGTQIVSNSIAQFTPYDAVNIQGSSATLANNVIDAFHSVGGAAIRVCKGCQTGTSMDYDVVHAARGSAISWNGSSYSSLANFTAATGQEARGVESPAGFEDPANGNLSLKAGSPAVDSALTGTLTTPSGSIALAASDAWGGRRVDDAATANTGAGTISYADRGAYEMRNPGFEDNTAGWNTSVSSPGVTVTRVAGGHTGNWAALLTNTGSTAATCALNDSPNIVNTTTAGTYAGTLWVRSDTPGAKLTLRLREWMGNTALGQAKTSVTLTSRWQPVTVQYTAVDPGASTIDFNAYVMNAPPGSCFYADDASVAAGGVGPAAAGPGNRLTISDGAADDGLGASVAVSGDTMVVGAPYATVDGHGGQGAVYVFTASGSVWTQQAELTASDAAAYDHFGYSVAISGNTVAVGAPTAFRNGHVKQGAAYVFTRSGAVWTQQAKLTASDGAANYQIGYAVAVSGDTVVAGAAGCPTDLTPEWTTVTSLPGGRAYVFTGSSGVWIQQAELTSSGCVRSVAASGNTAVLGALGWGADVFSESSGVWTLQTTLKPSDLSGYYPVGRSVAVSGNTVVLGVPAGQGAAYVFTNSGGTWTQQAKLTASDGGAPDLFGTSVAISDGTVLAGAPGATVNGHANNGAAYVFTNSGGTWTQQAKLTASDGGANDQLGGSVAVSGNTVVAGAPYADSLNGAAYVFNGF